jgi:hypothetical protein
VSADTIYAYTGNPLNTFTGSFACPPVCRITGSFTVAQPFGPNQFIVSFTPASFSFTDGLQTLTHTNSNIFVSFSYVVTDSTGAFIEWRIHLAGASTGTGGSASAQIFSCGGLIACSAGIVDPSGPGFTGNDAAGLFTISTTVGLATNVNQPGTWSSATSAPVPEPGTMLLLGTGIAGLFGVKRRKSRRGIVALKILCFAFLVATCPGTARADSAFVQFSLVNNPSGNWSYGLTPTLGGSFQLYNSSSNFPGLGLGPPYGTLPVWNTPSNLSPFLGANTFGTQILPCPSCSMNIPPGFLILSPEFLGNLSVLRWTAPSAGTYTISGLFQGVDFQPHPTTDTHILHNGIAVYSNFLNTFAVPQNFSLQLQLNAGDTIDFAVGSGGDFLSNDSTGLVANINPVPEPGTMLLLGAGLVGIAARARRRKNL